MKNLVITMLLLFATLAGCKKSDSDIFSTATVTLVPIEGVVISRVQATMKAENINTKQTVTSSSFNSTSITVNLQKGAYRVTVNGLVLLTDANGITRTHSFRAYTDYCEFWSKESGVMLDIILM